MYYDIREVEFENLTITIENGAIERPKLTQFHSKSFRVLKNGLWGVFEGLVSDSEGLKNAEMNIIAEGKEEILEVQSSGKYEYKAKIDPRDISIEEKLNLLKEINKGILTKTKRIGYVESLKRFEYRDSSGNEVYYALPRIGISVVAIGKGESLQFISKRLMKPGGWEKLEKAFELVDEVNEILPKLLNAKVPPSGEMNVLMNPELAGVFIHEAFGHAVEADHVLQGSSVLIGKIGKRIAGENVSIMDDPSIEEFGFYPFDDEGVKAKGKVLVENGILKSYLHSKETAKKLGGEPGNGRSEGVAFPIVRMSNTYIKAGDFKFEELLEECKNGVFLLGSRGGETNPATGYFQFSAQYGYIVRNGEIGEMIRDVSLSGTLEILKDVKLGNKVEFDPGFCGKAFQTVPVADGAPVVLCRAKVGGA
ncbi:MAG: TldD/PmbA family protein [Archaeoglobaceae archaeon]|nr:TldD/PmbA family protein [Archaeoglobaceae archaeon]MDW8117568.1 TldD/PmbA family protein [Archaeoglobaceae archaeon]